jgi:hypothetical protein
MRHAKIRNKLVESIGDKKLSSREIFKIIQDMRTTKGRPLTNVPTMNELSNLLARDGRFQNVSANLIALWELKSS